MRMMLAVAAREYLSFFRSATGWVVLALYLLMTGYTFVAATLRPGQPATMASLFAVSQWLLLTVAPAISMRLMSEELRSNTIEPLMASPAGDPSIVLGKYLGAIGYLMTLLAATFVNVAALELLSAPDYGPIFTGYAGLALTGALYVAVGLFFSSLGSSQVVAFLFTLGFFFGLHVLSTQGAAGAPEPWSSVLHELSIQARLRDFAQGVFETRHVVFFVAASAFAVVLASLVVESRRWR